MIKVFDITKTGFSENNAKPLYDEVQRALNNEYTIVLDFSGVTAFTTLFFNNALGKFYLMYGPEEYSKRFKVENLSEIGNVTYKHFLENACKVYEMQKTGQMDAYNSIIQSED